jgi:hypothetical protein
VIGVWATLSLLFAKLGLNTIFIILIFVSLIVFIDILFLGLATTIIIKRNKDEKLQDIEI